MTADFDLNLLRVLEALLLERSVSGAAARLEISQSAVSHSLRHLREHFDDPLFVRIGNRMLPTPRAISLESFVQATLASLRQHLSQSNAFDPASSNRTFAINTTDVGEVVIMPRLLGALRRLAPSCRIRFVSLPPEDVVAAFEQGAIDLSIGPQKFESRHLYQQLILDQELICLGSRAHYGKGRRFDDIGRFAALPHLAINPYGRDEDVYEWAFAGAGIRRQFVCTVHSFVAIPYLVQHSDVIATIPNSMPSDFIESEQSISIPLPFASPRMQIWQVWHGRFHTDPANQWLRKCIFSFF